MKAKHFYLILLGIVSLTMVWSCKEEEKEPFISFKDGGGDEIIGSQAKTWERQLVSNVEFGRLSAHSSDGWCDAKLESSDNGIVLN